MQQSGLLPCSVTSQLSGAQHQAQAQAGSRSYAAVAASHVQTVPGSLSHGGETRMPSYAEAVRVPVWSESTSSERSNDAISCSIGSCEDMSIGSSSSCHASRSTAYWSQSSLHAHCASSQHAHHVRGRPRQACQRYSFAAHMSLIAHSSYAICMHAHPACQMTARFLAYNGSCSQSFACCWLTWPAAQPLHHCNLV